MKRRCPSTLDLLSWTPPETSRSFAAEEVRAASIGTKFCRAMALALKECGKSREEVAEEMSAYLREDVSLAMLNAYTSEARESHVINVTRYVALAHVTGDMRLLNLIAEMFDHVVIPRKFERLAQAFITRDRLKELELELDAEMRRAKRECGL